MRSTAFPPTLAAGTGLVAESQVAVGISDAWCGVAGSVGRSDRLGRRSGLHLLEAEPWGQGGGIWMHMRKSDVERSGIIGQCGGPSRVRSRSEVVGSLWLEHGVNGFCRRFFLSNRDRR